MHKTTAQPPRTRRCACGRRHRKWTAVAKCRWPRAVWVVGDGPYASVAHCVARRAHDPHFGRAYADSQTVMLFPTRPAAEHAVAFIDRLACGGVCTGPSGHEIVDLGADR